MGIYTLTEALLEFLGVKVQQIKASYMYIYLKLLLLMVYITVTIRIQIKYSGQFNYWHILSSFQTIVEYLRKFTNQFNVYMLWVISIIIMYLTVYIFIYKNTDNYNTGFTSSNETWLSEGKWCCHTPHIHIIAFFFLLTQHILTDNLCITWKTFGPSTRPHSHLATGFISELLGGEVSSLNPQIPPQNAEICNKLYCK